MTQQKDLSLFPVSHLVMGATLKHLLCVSCSFFGRFDELVGESSVPDQTSLLFSGFSLNPTR